MTDYTIDYLDKYNLEIQQYKKGYRFSTDAVLLGEFPKKLKNQRLLEIGTGSGVISLILKKRYPDIKMTAVELQNRYFELAEQNFSRNKCSSINLINDDISNYKDLFVSKSFDGVVVNPPFYEIGKGLIPQTDELLISKFEKRTSLKKIIKMCRYLLKDDGYIYFIYIPERMPEIIQYLENTRYSIDNLVLVFPKNKNTANYFLCKAKKGKNSSAKIEKKEI